MSWLLTAHSGSYQRLLALTFLMSGKMSVPHPLLLTNQSSFCFYVLIFDDLVIFIHVSYKKRASYQWLHHWKCPTLSYWPLSTIYISCTASHSMAGYWWAQSCADNRSCYELKWAMVRSCPEYKISQYSIPSSGLCALLSPLLHCPLSLGGDDVYIPCTAEQATVTLSCDYVCGSALSTGHYRKKLLWPKLTVSANGHKDDYVEDYLIDISCPSSKIAASLTSFFWWETNSSCYCQHCFGGLRSP